MKIAPPNIDFLTNCISTDEIEHNVSKWDPEVYDHKVWSDTLARLFKPTLNSKHIEKLTGVITGYSHDLNVNGFDIYRNVNGTIEYGEVKSQSYYDVTDGTSKKTAKQLDGTCSFSDLNQALITKKIMGNATMYYVGYVVNHVYSGVVCVISFPFNDPKHIQFLRDKVDYKLKQNMDNGTMSTNRARYGFNFFKDIEGLKVEYIMDNIERVKGYMTAPLYNFLVANKSVVQYTPPEPVVPEVPVESIEDRYHEAILDAESIEEQDNLLKGLQLYLKVYPDGTL